MVSRPRIPLSVTAANRFWMKVSAAATSAVQCSSEPNLRMPSALDGASLAVDREPPVETT